MNLEVKEAEVFAFLGPNGAGKTTTIRILLDLIRPDSGTVRLFGEDLRRHSRELRRRIGYLPGELALYEHLTARELLTHFAYLRGGPTWPRIAALVEAFDLEVDRPIKTLSKGNRQKVGLIQALMGDPALLILDEPTSGLDPLMQTQVRSLVRQAVGEGRTVFFSSHVLSEVDQVADRVGIINEGILIDVADVAALKKQAAHYVDVRFAGGIRPGDLDRLAGVTVRAAPDSHIHLAVQGSLDPLLAVLAAHPVEDLAVRDPDLEDVFFASLQPNPPILSNGARRVSA